MIWTFLLLLLSGSGLLYFLLGLGGAIALVAYGRYILIGAGIILGFYIIKVLGEK